MEETAEKTKSEPAYWQRLTPERAYALYRQIFEKMKKDKTYRRPDYTVKMLAAALHTNTRYLAAALALAGDTNYNQLVNTLRLREVCRYFKSPAHETHSAEYIGLLAGFASRQAFYTAFRKAYGCTPNAYRKQIKETKK